MEEVRKEISKKSKEIVIKLNKRVLLIVGIVVLIVALLAVIGVQQYYIQKYKTEGITPPEVNDTEEDTESSVVGTIEEEVEEEVVEEEAETTASEQEVEEEEPEKLDITGDVLLTIDKINVDPKPSIDDYARVTSVKFTIKNQDEDFTPTVNGYLEQYEGEDEKDITLDELEAGDSITETSAKLVFGYNNIDTAQTLVIEVYDEKDKLLAKETKKFSQPS